MKIILKSNISIGEISSLKDTIKETQSDTLAALLDELSNATEIEFFDRESKELYPDCLVLVNGQAYGVLPDGLDTKLQDGDKVELVMFTIAGG